jgi:hypothetical protein
VSGQRTGEGFKVLVFGLLIAGMLFDLSLTIDGAKAMSGLVGDLFDSVNDLTGNGANT